MDFIVNNIVNVDTHPFEPFIKNDTKYLIVGTIPPHRFCINSLEDGDVKWFYGSKDNSFWKIISSVFDVELNDLDSIEKRKEFIQHLNPIVSHFYEIISGGKETVQVEYDSHLLAQDWQRLLTENLDKDRQLTYTSKGIHKDDLHFKMNQQFIKKNSTQLSFSFNKVSK